MLEEFSSKNRARYKNLELVICDFKNMEFGEITQKVIVKGEKKRLGD